MPLLRNCPEGGLLIMEPTRPEADRQPAFGYDNYGEQCMKCKECRWFEPQRTESDSHDFKTGTTTFIQVGICRKYPPQRTVFQDDGRTLCGWPITRSTDWCGEWETHIPSELTLEVRIVQTLKDWRGTHAGKPMQMWRLERKLRTTKTELRPVLDQLVANGDIAYIHIPTNGRPTGGYYLPEK